MEPTLAEIIVGQGNAARHPEIVLRLAPDLESLLGPTRRWLEDAIAGGARFLPGETVQLGWTLCKVNERADGRLSLLAPDMSSMPIEWTDDLSLAVQHLAVQYQAVKSIGVEPAFPNMRHSVLVGRDFDDTDVVIMHHQGSDGPADSGWFVGSESHGHDYNDPSLLSRVSVYEAALRQPVFITFLAMPAGVCVRHAPTYLDVFHNGEVVEVPDDSYLGRLFEGS